MKQAKDPFASVRAKAAELVAQMTLEEKAALCAGSDFWHTRAVERLGLPAVMVTDGPNGLRKQAASADHLGINDSVPATCFPTAAATACSFDPELLYEMGQAMGEECRAEQVAVILGPAANIKRSPLCGRNFEYFSEDPLVTGEAAAAMIGGIQSRNVGTSLKHYLANNQEKARLTSNSVIDERALREIYLSGFERAVKKAQPWTLMCSYNQINGTYASDNKRMMTDIPRGEWDYQGMIVTDWGAMNDRVQAIRAGLDLEMPGPCEGSCRKIVEAVREGRLEEAQLDTCARRVTAMVLQSLGNTAQAYDEAAHHELARRIARESAVLLKKGRALPADPAARIAVVGAFAKTPRYQGAGSGKIHPTRITSLCEALDARGIAYQYAPGYEAEEATPNEEMIRQAVAAAQQADVVFACAGLPDSFESEGFDRTHMELPESQNALMEALAETGKPVVAVLSTGSAVILPWRDKVDSILLLYLAGQNGGSAAADLLFGDANPGGKLAESWPLSLEDNPSYLHFGKGGNVEYRESIYVGYRYYDKAGLEVQYPFGHGLSYTEFAYSDLKLEKSVLSDTETLNLSLTVKNTGALAGSEVVQIYVAPPEGAAFRPVRELRAFAKVHLAPGESRQVSFTLEPRDFAYYNVNISDWFVESGVYQVQAGSSSRDIRLSEPVTLQSSRQAEPQDLRRQAPAYYAPDTRPLDIPKEQFEALLGRTIEPWHGARPYTPNTTISELRSCAMGRQIADQVVAAVRQMMAGAGDIGTMFEAMLEDMPLRQLGMLAPDQFGGDKLDGLLQMLNAQPEE